MESQLYKIAAIAQIDERLDELMEDYGDLPEQLKRKSNMFIEKSEIVEQTQAILGEIKKFCSQAKFTLVELKDKEEKLAQKQFLVRNNKEFDAMTNEINHIKTEHEKLSDKLRSEGVKEDNIKKILDEQIRERDLANTELADKKDEIKHLSEIQNEELSRLNKLREKYIEELKARAYPEYERIRAFHKDAAVSIKKNSCSGCFSSLPPQIIVNIRTNPETLHYCEGCGRILIPEDIFVEVV